MDRNISESDTLVKVANNSSTLIFLTVCAESNCQGKQDPRLC